MSKAHAFLSHLIEVRGADGGVAIGAKIAVAAVVHEEYDDIRFMSSVNKAGDEKSSETDHNGEWATHRFSPSRFFVMCSLHNNESILLVQFATLQSVAQHGMIGRIHVIYYG